jgi:hypothetical protein
VTGPRRARGGRGRSGPLAPCRDDDLLPVTDRGREVHRAQVGSACKPAGGVDSLSRTRVGVDAIEPRPPDRAGDVDPYAPVLGPPVRVGLCPRAGRPRTVERNARPGLRTIVTAQRAQREQREQYGYRRDRKEAAPAFEGVHTAKLGGRV